MAAPVSDELAAARLDAWEGRSTTAWCQELGVPALELFARVGSTMDVARTLAEGDAPAGTLVVAEEQTAGRGQKGRPWFSAPGWSLHVSLLLRPAPDPGSVLSALPLRVGLATAGAVEEVAGVAAAVKWPNDVVTPEGRKLAGVLCEAAFVGTDRLFVVAGIGINVGQDTADFPPELRERASSLSRESGRLIPRGPVLEALLRRLLPLTRATAGPLSEAELAELRRRDALRGRPLWLDGQPVGEGAGIAADGALLVRGPDGRVEEVRAGTIRAAPSPERP